MIHQNNTNYIVSTAMLFTQWIINGTELAAHLLPEINLIPVTEPLTILRICLSLHVDQSRR